MGNSESKLNAVIAIEIGHVNSGFAYSLESSKDQIYTARHGCALPMDRVPTLVLLNKDGKFDSFGITARDRYLSLSLQEEHNNYRYFNSLEVVPGGEQAGYIVKDSEGNSVEAEKIYESVIKYLYNLCIKNIPNNGAKFGWVRVVFTIPHGSGDYMRDIIHTAAKKSGIEKGDTCITFNGDATALYCSKQNLFVNARLATSRIKTNYVLMNLGGRRTEILTKRFVDEAGKEFQEPRIVSCGGESVTELFLTVLGSMKDKKEWSNFKHTCIYDYERMKLNFDKFKYKFDGTGKFILELPSSFCKLPENNEGEQSIILEEIVYAADINKIVLTKEAMEKLFDPTIEQIVIELKSIQTIGQGGEEVTILIAGGFSESPYVRKVISREMNPSKVLLVPNANLDVLKGAVMVGYKKFRRSKYFYGFLFQVYSNQSELRENMMTEERERFEFQTIIEKRELLENERVYVKIITMTHKTATKPVMAHLQKTKKEITDFSSVKLADFESAGSVEIQPPESGWETGRLHCELKIIVKEKGLQLVFTEKESKRESVSEVPY